MLERDLIARRLNTFWGYGRLDAPVWFVGMEEGGGDDLAERFTATDGKSMVDIRSDMQGVPNHLKFYTGEKPPIQGTLSYPIRLFLDLKHRRPAEREEVRQFQRHHFGDVHDGTSASLELMPLPSRSIGDEDWQYDGYGIASLASRQKYLDTHLPRRTEELRSMIADHQPRLIIFYSLAYINCWIKAVGNIEPEKITKQMLFGKYNDSSFCIIPQDHPGMSNARIDEFAEEISSRVRL